MALGGGVGAALGSQLAAAAEVAAERAGTEQLLSDNERLRREAEELLWDREQQRRLYDDEDAYLAELHRSIPGSPESSSLSPDALQKESSDEPMDCSAAVGASAAGDDGGTRCGFESGLGGDSPKSSSAAASREESKARQKRQRQIKARRILRTAVQLAKSNLDRSGSSSWSLSGLEFAKLARVASEVSKISDALKTSEFFQDLGERQLAMMAASGVRRKFQRYNCLYREGATATCFYVLVGGGVLEQSSSPAWKEPELAPGKRRPPGYRRDRRLLTCPKRAGSKFTLLGMESLVGRKRDSTITVLDEGCELVRFQAGSLNIRSDGAAQVARKVFNAFLEGELAHTHAFRGLPMKQVKALVTILEQENYEAGEALYAPGNPGDKVFLLMHGSVAFFKGSTPLATLTAEQGSATATEHGMPIFGENAMLDRRPRALTCRVTADSKLLVVPLEQWAAMTMAVPDFKARLKKQKEIRAVDLG